MPSSRNTQAGESQSVVVNAAHGLQKNKDTLPSKNTDVGDDSDNPQSGSQGRTESDTLE